MGRAPHHDHTRRRSGELRAGLELAEPLHPEMPPVGNLKALEAWHVLVLDPLAPQRRDALRLPKLELAHKALHLAHSPLCLALDSAADLAVDPPRALGRQALDEFLSDKLYGLDAILCEFLAHHLLVPAEGGDAEGLAVGRVHARLGRDLLRNLGEHLAPLLPHKPRKLLLAHFEELLAKLFCVALRISLRVPLALALHAPLEARLAAG
mmetsp:Transcript_7631/g.19556  ORF Transcript_7631/g.19556 Transcript_7631/m.19556 type:complete len:209 (-) Transcript_7631:266-892(-)